MIEEKKTVQDRGIAIALSALMVLSVVAVGAAAITPAAAQTVDQADRSAETTEVQAGDTVNVTVDVSLESADSFQIDEGFDPAFADVEIIDDDDASFSTTSDANDRAVARYGTLGDDPRQDATLVYQVTIPDDAEAGDSFEISSNADSDVQLGSTVLTVPSDVGSRTVPDSALSGETVEVTVDVSFDQAQSFQIDEGLDSAFADAEIADDDDASFSTTSDANDRVVARYGTLGDDPRQDATLVYNVTIPADAEAGDTFEISSNEDSDVQLGTDVIDVVDQEPAEYMLSSLAPADATVTEGDDPIDVSADVENMGDLAGNQTVELDVLDANGNVAYNDSVADVELDGGDNMTVTFTDVPAGALDAGEYDHQVSTDDDTIAGNLTVEEEMMNVAFNQQGVGLQGQSPAVYATNVDSAGGEAALVVTYENDTTGDLVIAGLTTGTYDGETVQVPLGTSDAALGGFPGEHTAHIIPVDGLSGQYAPGDTVSAETAANVSDNAMAPVYNWNVILSDQEFSENTSEITLDLGLVTDGMGDDTLYTVDIHPTDDQGQLIGSEYVGTTGALSGESDDVTIDLKDSNDNQITLEPGDEVEYIPMIHIVDDPNVEEGDDTVPGTFPALTTSVNGQVLPAINQSATISVVEGPPPVVGDSPPQDLDDDGFYEDIDGDGSFSVSDVQLFFQERDSNVVQNNPEFFNFDEGQPVEVSVSDVQALFQLFQSQ